jgi:ADP-heptose:LPS heptosyltransferase
MRASIATLGIKAKVKLGFDRERASDGQWLFTNHRVPSRLPTCWTAFSPSPKSSG